MKKIVLALLVVFISRAAYAVPKGCFVAEYEASCHSAYFSSYDCDQYNMSSYNFGLYMKSMCDYVNSVEFTSATCLNTLATRTSQRDYANAQYAVTEKNRQEWITYAGKRDKLIK